MLFRQLEYFVAVAREQHFARAAAACYVTQPALSAAIAKLEEELGVSLIYRDHAFEGLTPEGQRLVTWAQRILAEHDAFKSEVQALQSGVTGTLRLGIIPTTSTTVALPVSAFCSVHPLARVNLTAPSSTVELSRRLRDFELDAALTYSDDEPDPSLDYLPLYSERYVVVGSSSVLAGQDGEITLRETSNLPLALLSRELRSRQLIDATFAGIDVALEPQIETGSVASLQALVRSGRWASIIPHSWLQAEPRDGSLTVLSLSDQTLTGSVSVAIHAGNPGSLIAKEFARIAVSLRLQDVLDEQFPTREALSTGR